MPEREFIRLCYVADNVRLAILRGLLEAEGIDYYVHNDHFGSLRVGPSIPLLNERAVMVSSGHEAKAREILEFLEDSSSGTDREAGEYSFLDKLRMIGEVLVFGWFMPGRGRRN